MMASPVEFILYIFIEKILINDFYDVLERRKIKLKCTKIRLLTVYAANRIMKKHLNKLHTVLVTDTEWL